jgi:hypothetical protein
MAEEIAKAASTTSGRTHDYHAEAKALHGELHRPFKQVITPQALAQLHPTGGYLDQDGEAFGAERAIAYDSAYTHVSGSLETKPNGGWCTLTTCAIVNLNILEIVTADRIVSQIFTEHPLVGYVPRISFLATRFENLRIAGHKVELDWDMNMLGGKPEGDGAYSRHPGLLENLRRHSQRICGYDALPAEAHGRYNQVPKKIVETTETGETGTGETRETEILECSLVTGSRGNFPGRSFGHVIHVPDFGDIYLATVKVTHEDFHHGIPKTTTVELKMVEAKLGCAATGLANAGVCVTNGVTRP